MKQKFVRRAVIYVLGAAVLCLILAGAAYYMRAYFRPDAAGLEADIRRAAVYCYAAEGRYPPDLAYLKEEYGVRYDNSRFHVFYQPVSSNLAPEITVVLAEENA